MSIVDQLKTTLLFGIYELLGVNEYDAGKHFVTHLSFIITFVLVKHDSVYIMHATLQ